MKIENKTFAPPNRATANVFFWGFLIRLVYGALALPIMVLVQPDLLGDKRMILIGSFTVYLLVCIAGGAYDASVGKQRLQLFRRPRTMDLILIGIWIFFLWSSR